jgi:hypothetical protein
MQGDGCSPAQATAGAGDDGGFSFQLQINHITEPGE